MTARMLSAAESRHLDDRIALQASAPGSVALGPVYDERGHVGVERMEVPWALLRALPPAELDLAMELLTAIAAQPHVEVFEVKYPEALGIIRRGRPRPAITRVTNPAPRRPAGGMRVQFAPAGTPPHDSAAWITLGPVRDFRFTGGDGL